MLNARPLGLLRLRRPVVVPIRAHRYLNKRDYREHNAEEYLNFHRAVIIEPRIALGIVVVCEARPGFVSNLERYPAAYDHRAPAVYFADSQRGHYNHYRQGGNYDTLVWAVLAGAEPYEAILKELPCRAVYQQCRGPEQLALNLSAVVILLHPTSAQS